MGVLAIFSGGAWKPDHLPIYLYALQRVDRHVGYKSRKGLLNKYYRYIGTFFFNNIFVIYLFYIRIIDFTNTIMMF